MIFFFNDTTTAKIYTLSLHDALPILSAPNISGGNFLDFTDSHIGGSCLTGCYTGPIDRSEENTFAVQLHSGVESGVYIDKTLNLGPNLAGQTVTLRFRMGSDEAVAAP